MSGIDRMLQQWRMSMIAQSLSSRTIDERIRVLKQFSKYSGKFPLNASTDDIVEWLATKRNNSTKWSYLSHLRAFYRWATLTDRIDDNPTRVIPSPRRPRYKPRPVSPVHIDYVLSQNLRKKTRTMILLAAFAGLRVHEIAKVHGRDYDQLAGQLTVLGKGSQIAVIPINEQLQQFFNTMPTNDWWFPSRKGGHIHRASVGNCITRAFSRNGIRIEPHQLRHSFGTQLLRVGGDIRVVQTLMRHASIQSTALYVDVEESQARETTNLLKIDPPQIFEREDA